MTRSAVAEQVRGIARRLERLGADLPEIDLLNDSQASFLALLAAIVDVLERQDGVK